MHCSTREAATCVIYVGCPMRFAVFVGPSSHAAFDPAAPVGALGDKLLRGGYKLTHVALEGDLEPALIAAMAAAGTGDSVLVYVAGTMALEESKLTLRVPGDGRAPFVLGALGSLVKDRSPKDALFVIDAAHDEPTADGMRAAEYVEAAIDAVAAKKHGFSMLVAAAGGGPASGPHGEWAFTRLLVDALDDPGTKDERGATFASRVYAHLRSNGVLTERVPSFAHVRGEAEFELLPPEAPRSAPPAPVPRGASVPPSSVPPAAAPPASMPPPSMPPPSGASIASLLEGAESAWKKEAWDEAFAAYKKALMLAPATAERASIYMRLGEVKKRQAKPREAELNFEKAIEADKTNRGAHEALVLLAEEARDFRRVVSVRKRMREALGDPTQLLFVADVLETELHDAGAAIAALEEARGLLPGDKAVLGRLRRLYEAKERWRKLLDVTAELADATADPKERAVLRFAQADVALGRLRDEERGLGWLESTLDDDPAHDKALSALVAVRTRRKEWERIDKVYAKLIDRFAITGDAERAWQTCSRLGLLRRDAMSDPEGAIDAFRGALRCRPGDVEAEAALADLLMSKGDLDSALERLMAMAKKEPLRFGTYRKLYELHTRAGRTDRAWLAATALEELGAADMNHQLVIDQYRAHHTQVVRPAAVFDDKHWREWIRAEGADEAVAAILRAVGRAAAELRVKALRKEKRLFSLNPERRQSTTSTVSIVRTFVWASQVLDVPLPELYVYDEVPGGLAAVQGDARATAIGPAVLSGMPLQELSFVVARHLTYYRPEHYALVFYPTLPDLLQLFLSAVEVGLPDMAVSSRGGASGKKLVTSLRKLLSDPEKEQLGLAAARFEERGGRVDLAAWIRGVELTATRAGLVLAGDLAVAMRVLRRETRSIADISIDDKRADLLAYSASEPFGKLRDELAITAAANTAPTSAAQLG
jgi:tetratricopeptide (TPR) repeat protein